MDSRDYTCRRFIGLLTAFSIVASPASNPLIYSQDPCDPDSFKNILE
jgi:hypothetical protein